jgi:hypothetical protein
MFARMTDTRATVNCAEHGPQQETFVCQHIVEGLRDGRRVGFFSAIDPDNPRPDAWCSECHTRLQRCGGDWVGEAQAQLGAKVLCGACYDRAKSFHRGNI